MKRARIALIIVHFITNSVVQLFVIGGTMLYWKISPEEARWFHVISLIVVAIDAIVVLLLKYRLKNQLDARDVFHVQFIDWPLILYGYIAIFIFDQSDYDLMSFYVPAIEVLWLTERLLTTLLLLPKKGFMISLDEVMEMLDDRNPLSVQEDGLFKSRYIKSVFVFIMPPATTHVWENCAKIISEKKDATLQPYLYYLFQWAKKAETPGALIILSRLQEYKKDSGFMQVLEYCLTEAKQNQEAEWIRVLEHLK